MFSRGTILARREPFIVPDLKADPPVEGDPAYVYNRVRVIGVSPVAHMGGTSNWGGVAAQGVIIEPVTGFGGNVDRPLGELQRDYTIESEPEPLTIQSTVRVINAQTREAGPTPEEVFAESASSPTGSKPRRGRAKKVIA